jgi:ethanolaminephosphotransferase
LYDDNEGCDAMNTTFGSLIGAAALNLGQTWLAVLSLVVTSANFYLSTWEEYHTGVLYLGYINGPDEGVLMLIGIYLISAFKGPQWWSQNIRSVFNCDWLPAWQINETFIYACMVLMIFILTSW